MFIILINFHPGISCTLHIHLHVCSVLLLHCIKIQYNNLYYRLPAWWVYLSGSLPLLIYLVYFCMFVLCVVAYKLSLSLSLSLHISLWILKILRICVRKWTDPQTATSQAAVWSPWAWLPPLLISKYPTISRYRDTERHDISISSLGYDMNPNVHDVVLA